MQLKQFERSLSDPEPSAELNEALRVLWFDGCGDWEAAHDIAQDMAGQDGAWLHGFLHRREGDLPNADYWYRRAGKERPDVDLEDEWRALVTWFGADRSGPA